MKKPALNIAILLIFFPLIIQCQETYPITTESSSRILKMISSDEMRGRRALTPDIEKAADFIVSEFENTSLTPLPGYDSFRQSFNLSEFNIESATLTFDGSSVARNNFFGFIYTDKLNWNGESVSTATIGKGENFQQKFGEYSNTENDLLIFVDQSHEGIFSRYQPFFSRPSRTVDTNGKSNVVFVMVSETPGEFSVNIEASVQEKPLTNIVGIIEGKRSDEIVLFSAHYDHIGIQAPVEGDSIANGANDNGSGVTAIIELANYFSSQRKPERTLMFATFTAEEIGGYGSQYFSKQLNPDEIIAMFNIEMIGKPAVAGPNTAWITGYDRSTFGELLSNSAPDSVYDFYPDPYPQQNLFYRSDNATLARLGVPAHSISTTPIDVDLDYHNVSDEFETINISHMTNTIKAIANAAKGMISGKDTPTRVDKSLVD